MKFVSCFLLVVFIYGCAKEQKTFPKGVVGVLHVDDGTDYVFKTAPSPVSGACEGWNTISIQKPGPGSTGMTKLMCWKEKVGMLHTATARAESPDVFPMKGITTPY